MTKITMAGAGSVTFAKQLMSDILRYAEMAESTVTLMDSNAARLATAKKVGDAFVRQLAPRARVEASITWPGSWR